MTMNNDTTICEHCQRQIKTNGLKKHYTTKVCKSARNTQKSSETVFYNPDETVFYNPPIAIISTIPNGTVFAGFNNIENAMKHILSTQFHGLDKYEYKGYS